MTVALRAYLSGHPPPWANPPEDDDVFAARVLRGALAPPFDAALVDELANGLYADGVARGEGPGPGPDPDAWLSAVAGHLETLAARGRAPADLLGRFPEVAQGLRLRPGALLPCYAAALLAAWLPHTEAAAAAVESFLRATALWRHAPTPRGAPVSDVTPLDDDEAARWWSDRFGWWATDRASMGSVFGTQSGCPLIEQVALAAQEELDRAGLPRPPPHPPPVADPSRLVTAWFGVDRLVVTPALAWRALAAVGREVPRDVAAQFKEGRLRGRRRVTWGQAPDPFGPLAEVVAQGLVPLRASVFAPDVHLGLPCSPLAWAYLARPRPEPARFDLGWWDSALRPAADRPVYPLGR